MAIELLMLADGHCSLEFAPEDMAAVRKAIITLHGKPTVQWHAVCADIRFGGCNFTFQDEWDDPCLISGSDEGDALLRELHARLTG
jgi:hypothetical protein